jgi:Mg/Co/Ni transporter MgtE
MVADLIDMMTPGQAADVLSVLTLEDQEAIMELMEEENLNKIKSILEKRQDTYSTS